MAVQMGVYLLPVCSARAMKEFVSVLWLVVGIQLFGVADGLARY